MEAVFVTEAGVRQVEEKTIGLEADVTVTKVDWTVVDVEKVMGEVTEVTSVEVKLTSTPEVGTVTAVVEVEVEDQVK